MKKHIILSVSIILMLFSVGKAVAHPPKNMGVSWNKEQKTLSVTAEHAVNDPSKHYILSMSILDGNNQLLVKQYTKQSSSKEFSDSVVLKDIAPNTKIRIQLLCNIMGSTETTYLIP